MSAQMRGRVRLYYEGEEGAWGDAHGEDGVLYYLKPENRVANGCAEKPCADDRVAFTPDDKHYALEWSLIGRT